MRVIYNEMVKEHLTKHLNILRKRRKIWVEEWFRQREQKMQSPWGGNESCEFQEPEWLRGRGV